MPSVDQCRGNNCPRGLTNSTLAVIFSLLLVLAANGQTGQASDRQAIQTRAGPTSWTRGTVIMLKLSRRCSPRTPTSPDWRGTGASGRSKMEEFHPMFATIFKNSHHPIYRNRYPLGAPMWPSWMFNGKTGATDPQTNPHPARQGLLSDDEKRTAAGDCGDAQPGHRRLAAGR
jgi:hypothetical protein